MTPNLETDQNNVAVFLRLLRDEFERLLAERDDLQERAGSLYDECKALRAALEDILTGAEQQSQSHADVIAKCRRVL